MKQFHVYIMANDRPTLYVGVTSNLIGRSYQHKAKLVEGFTKQYDLWKLVYFEPADTAEAAIRREKRLKKWNRQWKLDLIQQLNPTMEDLYPGLVNDPPVKPWDDGE